MPSAQYTSIYAQVIEWTNKPAMTVETKSAIRSAVRHAHKAGKFWRDLVTVPVGPVAIEQIQQIDLTAYPRFRQLATLKSPQMDKPLTVVDVLSLVDQDGYAVTNICYGLGTSLAVRAETPSDTYTLTYYAHPDTSDIENVDDWLCELHEDVIVLWAASSVLAMTGEQEIKTRVELLLRVALGDLLSDEIELIGR